MADVTYSRVNWEDSPSTDTPINATNLNKMDAGISQVVTRANESMPYANILDDWTDIGAVTTPNTYTADAMRVAELNTSLNDVSTNGNFTEFVTVKSDNGIEYTTITIPDINQFREIYIAPYTSGGRILNGMSIPTPIFKNLQEHTASRYSDGTSKECTVAYVSDTSIKYKTGYAGAYICGIK